MVLIEGEFECDECNGNGSVQAIQTADKNSDKAEPVWDKCEDCRGQDTVCVDEKEATEKILYGQTPTRTPGGA